MNVRIMLLNKKNNRYKTTFEVFSQTTCNVRRIVCQEVSRERKNTEGRATATPKSATEPALPPEECYSSGDRKSPKLKSDDLSKVRERDHTYPAQTARGSTRIFKSHSSNHSTCSS